MKKLKLYEQFINENLRKELKKFIKDNEDELNTLADNELWDRIENMINNEFNVRPGSTESKEIIKSFMLIF